MTDALPYELDALRRASNYQRWIADAVMPYLGARILEVGAGVGSISRWLPLRDRLVLTERDPALLELLRAEVAARFGEDDRVAVVAADLSAPLPLEIARGRFDTVVSFNVLEHVADDANGFSRLVHLLLGGGGPEPRRIVTLVPAHQWAYGTIDAAYGHVRRYSARSFTALARECCRECTIETRYFNAFGLPGWLLMGRILRVSAISTHAVEWFERLCPYVRHIDDFLHAALHLPLGQSLIAVVTLRHAARETYSR
jgi:SAM-dependent methyltransferase